ncbi:MAG TPA: HEAT repeat domain-containing protein [Aggregatilineaceae bacterium]|nr:HEAT repeat domain-containing protein [Aggregatilineaceae bacterium]
MSHIYISYSQDNGEFVGDLIRQIEDAGFQVWADQERLRATEEWSEGIDQAIRDAFAMIVIPSPTTQASEQMMYEWMFALGVGIRILTLTLQPVAVHPRLESVPRLDFSDTSALPWGKLIRHLQDARGTDRPFSPFRTRPSTPAPSPFGAPRRPSASPPPASGGLLDRIRRREDIYDDPDEDDDLFGSASSPAPQEDVARLIKALGHDNRDERIAAARRLSEMGEKSAVPGLIRMLRDDDWRVRDAAVQALGKLKAAAAVAAMLEGIRTTRPSPFGGSPNTTVIEDALVAIGKPCIPILMDAMSDDDARIRLIIIEVLGQLNSAEALPAFTEALRDPEWRVRWRAADAIGKLGDPAAVPDLLQILRDMTKDVRIAAAWSLGQIRSAEAVPGLIKLLSDRDWRVRWAAAEALWTIGEEAAAPLITVLTERDEYIRRAASRTLAEIGVPAIPVLIEALSHTNWDVRCAACAALEQIGDAAIPALLDTLQTAGWQASWAAAETLKQIGTPDALKAVEAWDEPPPA